MRCPRASTMHVHGEMGREQSGRPSCARSTCPLQPPPRSTAARIASVSAPPVMGGQQIVVAQPRDFPLGVAEEPRPAGFIVTSRPSVSAVKMQSSTLSTTEASKRSPRLTSSSVTRSDCCICWKEATSCCASSFEIVKLVLHDHARRGGAQRRGEEPLEADAAARAARARTARPAALPRNSSLMIASAPSSAHVVVHEALDLGRRQDRGRRPASLSSTGRADERGGLRAIVGILLGQERDHARTGRRSEERPEHAVTDASRGP